MAVFAIDGRNSDLRHLRVYVGAVPDRSPTALMRTVHDTFNNTHSAIENLLNDGSDSFDMIEAHLRLTGQLD